ncbi:MAG: serine hydrolase domain-containing protein, partial [Bacteroidota bacterium]
MLTCHTSDSAASIQYHQGHHIIYLPSPTSDTLRDWIDLRVNTVMLENEIPALSIAVIQGGDILIQKGYGVLNRETKLAVDAHSIYQIASDTKKMTGIIARSMTMEGIIDPHASITDYIPQLDATTTAKLAAVTLHGLLTHKSGVPYKAPRDLRVDGEPMTDPYTAEELVLDLADIELIATPGEKFAYSNFGFAIAGYVLQQASGLSYEALLQRYVFEPCGMIQSTTDASVVNQSQLVTPYRKEDRFAATKPFVMGELKAAGGVFSSVHDLTNLMMRQIESYADLSASQIETSPFILTEMTGVEGNDYGYGLGKKVFGTGVQYGHGGDLDGYASGYVFSPQYKSGVILLTSSGGSWVGELEKEILYKLTNRTYTPPKTSFAQALFDQINSVG